MSVTLWVKKYDTSGGLVMNEINKNIGIRVETLRKELGMTHERFAEHLQVSPSQVRNYQKGRQPVPADIIDRLSNGNDLLKSWLLCQSDIKDLSDIVKQSIAILNSFSPNDVRMQDALLFFLQRYGYSQLDVGIDSYPSFISYMDEQIRCSIETYIRYFNTEH